MSIAPTLRNLNIDLPACPSTLVKLSLLMADENCSTDQLASLIETAKANQLEPAAYVDYVLNHIGAAPTPEQIEALLPWNVPLERAAKKA